MKKSGYSISIKNNSEKSILKFSKEKISNFGFCLLEDIIQPKNVNSIRREIVEAKRSIDDNIKKILSLKNKGLSEDYIFKRKLAKLRPQKGNRCFKAVNDLIWMPKFCKIMSNSIILNILHHVMDGHVRMSQIHPFLIRTNYNKDEFYFKNDLFQAPRIISNLKNSRDWHTDWRHDPWGYGLKKFSNIGSIKEPFPDVTMSLTVIWYLSDSINQNGTFLIPKSHKFGFSPRGKKKSYLKMPSEIQISSKSGSVLIMDSRLWHSPPPYNNKGIERISVVNRWSPWWLSINDYAPDCSYDVVCRPLSEGEYKKMPSKLKPFLVHLCPSMKENIQRKIVERSKISIRNTKKIIKQFKFK